METLGNWGCYGNPGAPLVLIQEVRGQLLRSLLPLALPKTTSDMVTMVTSKVPEFFRKRETIYFKPNETTHPSCGLPSCL